MDLLLNNEKNNFNLIRLLACIQVLVLHSLDFYDLWYNNFFYRIWWLFPGVIIFFSISGFLIAASFDRSDIYQFSKKRFLRIFPALAANVFITTATLHFFGLIAFNFDLFKFLVCQLTVFQFFVPESIKKFGLGHPNGALWTISVEIQFYLLFCLMGYFLKWKRKSANFKTVVIIFLIVLSSLLNYYSNNYLDQNTVYYKLVFNSIFYNFTFFGVGILVWINLNRIKLFLNEKFIFWFIALTISIILIDYHRIPVRRYQFDAVSFIYLILLITTVFSFAFSFKSLSYKLLGNTDISYGTYLYHCLIINLFLQLNLSSKYIIQIYIISLVMGYLSWYVIEKRFIIKKHTIHKTVC